MDIDILSERTDALASHWIADCRGPSEAAKTLLASLQHRSRGASANAAKYINEQGLAYWSTDIATLILETQAKGGMAGRMAPLTYLLTHMGFPIALVESSAVHLLQAVRRRIEKENAGT